MKVSGNLSIIFFVEKSEMSKDGRAPIYARITLFGGGSRCGNLALSAAISSLDCCCSTVVTVMTFVTLGA